MDADASNPERRHVYAIFLEPQPATSTAAVTAKDRQKALASATAAAAALDEGTSFEVVAQQYSTDASKSQGGDYGFISASDTVDPAWVQALFALPLNGTRRSSRAPTARTGSARSARLPLRHWTRSSTGTWCRRSATRATATTSAWRPLPPSSSQRSSPRPPPATSTRKRLAEIYIGVASGTDPTTDTGTVHASHILYSPAHDPANQGKPPAGGPRLGRGKGECPEYRSMP